MPVPDRRAEFVFGTAAEVMQMMSNLPSKVVLFRPGDTDDAKAAPVIPEKDDMAAAIRAQKSGPGK